MNARGGAPLQHAVARFLDYLRVERRYAPRTADNYAHELTLLTRHAETQGVRNWKALQPAQLQALVAAEHRRGRGAGSLHHLLAACRSFFRWLLREGELDASPAAGVRAPKLRRKLPHVLDVDQAQRLMELDADDALAARDRAALELLYSSGLRVAELCGVRWRDLDLDEGLVRVTGKGSKTRVVPVGSQALAALRAADTVIAFAPYAGERLRELADVILPIGLTPEIDATLVNLQGVAQTVSAGARLPGEARPGWKALRALGGLLTLPGFGFNTLDELRGELAPLLAQHPAPGSALGAPPGNTGTAGLQRVVQVPIYRGDAVLRRAPALQEHPLSEPVRVWLRGEDALALGLNAGVQVRVGEVSLDVGLDPSLPRGAARIDATHPETVALPAYGAIVELAKA